VNWEDVIIDAAVTDTGMRRSNNQDSYSVVRASTAETWRQRGHLFMVADGMGAHAVGELASKLACDNIPHNYNKIKTGTPVEAITKTYREVSALIHGKASANRDFQGMGTTCSTLLLLPEGALIAHVGDSRVYRVRGDRIDQLSFDHSLVWELVRRNHLSFDAANIAVPKNVITRSLGPELNVDVDIEGPFAVELNDVYLLCSDGLSGLASDPEIGAFAAHFHPEDACHYLMNLANLRGGIDNITLIVLRVGPWVDPDAPGSTSERAAATTSGNGKKGRGWKSGLFSLLTARHRTAALETVADHPYRTADCPISEELVDDLVELTRRVQEIAVDQAWSVDWTALTQLRREEAAHRSAGNRRGALRILGEIIVLLGTAARLYRKSIGPANVV
jgi:protein phosphatase